MASGGEQQDGGVLETIRALLGGLRDTADDVVEEGRRGANEAQERWWRRYDDLTKYRKSRDEEPKA